jgi:hypothetical protein
MACGLVVIEGETGLTFAPEDAETLAKRVEQLRNKPDLFTPSFAKNERL